MTKLGPHGILSAVELPYYSITFLLSVYICIKQASFSRNAGWLYLVTLSILRLIGTSCTLYMITHNDYSASLQETAAITSSIGTAPLLLVLMGLLERIHAQIIPRDRAFSKNVFRPIHIISIAALVLGIIGGTKESSSQQDAVNTGKACMNAAGIIFLVVYVALTVIAILTALSKKEYIPANESKLMTASIIVLPFLLVRVVFTVIVSFSDEGSVFYSRDVNVWAQAFMQFLMEAVTMVVYIWAGLLTPKEVVRSAAEENGRKGAGAGDVEDGYAFAQRGAVRNY